MAPELRFARDPRGAVGCRHTRFGAPDEGSHVVRAWSVAHGQLLGHDKGPVFREVTGPVVYRYLGSHCSFDPRNTRRFCSSIKSSSRTGSVRTYTGRYFPAYYLAVGLPTLVTSPGMVQLDLMRFVSVLLAAALLASAFVTASEARLPTFAGAGLLLAVTPTVLFLAGSVNPGGLEIAAAIAVWASGARLGARGPGALQQSTRRSIGHCRDCARHGSSARPPLARARRCGALHHRPTPWRCTSLELRAVPLVVGGNRRRHCPRARLGCLARPLRRESLPRHTTEANAEHMDDPAAQHREG